MKRSQIGLVFIVIMIIISVLIIVMLKWQFGFSEALKGKADKDRCKLSVTAASKLRLKSFEVVPNIDCCQQNYVIKAQEDVVPTLANALYDCYDQFLKGEANLFKDTGRFCFICSTIQFEDKAAVGDVEGFYGYFFNERPAGGRKTFAREFYGDQAESVRQQLLVQNQNLFDIPMAKTAYTMMFIHDRGLAAKDKTVPHLAPSFQRQAQEFERVRTGAETGVAVVQRAVAEVPALRLLDLAGIAVIPYYIPLRVGAALLQGGFIYYQETRPEATTEFRRNTFSLVPLEAEDLRALECDRPVRQCQKV